MKWFPRPGPIDPDGRAADAAIRARYVVAIEADDLIHDRDRRGFTAEQRERAAEYARMVNAGLNPVRVEFARHLVRAGLVRP